MQCHSQLHYNVCSWFINKCWHNISFELLHYINVPETKTSVWLSFGLPGAQHYRGHNLLDQWKWQIAEDHRHLTEVHRDICEAWSHLESPRVFLLKTGYPIHTTPLRLGRQTTAWYVEVVAPLNSGGLIHISSIMERQLNYILINSGRAQNRWVPCQYEAVFNLKRMMWSWMAGWQS